MTDQERRELLECAETELEVSKNLLATARANLDNPNGGATLAQLRGRYDAAVVRVEAAKASVRRLGGAA